MPGETRFAEAEQIVADLPFVHGYWINALAHGEHRYKSINWNSARDLGEPASRGTVLVRDGRVIEIELDRPRPLMTAGDVVDQYGDPQYVHTYSASIEVRLPRVALWYPSDGTVFHAEGTDCYAFDAEAQDYVLAICLAPTSEIWDVNYVSPGNPADQMAVYGLLGGVTMERLIPWPGFGSAIFR